MYESGFTFEMEDKKEVCLWDEQKKPMPRIKVNKDDPRAMRHFVKSSMKNGREIKVWECGLCGKEFRFQYTLVRHIPTHTDVRNFQCDQCPKAFRQLSTLAQHKATHLNMRPFSCDICDKSFNRISTLISHKKIHCDEKRHVCPVCKKGFHQKGNLRNHIYTHTNERPYKCEFCNKGFNQRSNLVCHKSSTHEKRQLYRCTQCCISFDKFCTYKHHLKMVHGRRNSTGSTSNSPAESSIDSDSNSCSILSLPLETTGKDDEYRRPHSLKSQEFNEAPMIQISAGDLINTNISLPGCKSLPTISNISYRMANTPQIKIALDFEC